MLPFKMLPFEPETLESIRARMPAALEELYTLEAVEADEQLPPGAQRRHVFDFEDGIRMAVSVDKNADTESMLHLSFSLWPGHPMAIPHFVERVKSLPLEIWPDTILLLLEVVSAGRAVHLFFEVPPVLVPQVSCK